MNTIEFTETQRQMAAMAFQNYRPSPANAIDLRPAGWTLLKTISRPNRGHGFDAMAYQSTNGEVVIAFRGTDGPSPLDWDDNLTISTGLRSEQVEHAIEIVADVMLAYPGADIRFTGHSLGGGLASLMAIYFDRPAYVFAPAPFQASAFSVTGLIGDYYAHFANYMRSRRPSIDVSGAFQEYADALGSDFLEAGNMFLAREEQVAGAFIDGEILEGLRAISPTVVNEGQFVEIAIGDTSMSGGPVDAANLEFPRFR